MMRILTALFIGFFVLAFASSCMTPRAQVKGVGNEGLVRIVCDPPSAEVYVDGQLVGKASQFDGKPGYLQVTSGRHIIELKKKGYKTYRQEIYASNAIIEIRATLIKEEE